MDVRNNTNHHVGSGYMYVRTYIRSKLYVRTYVAGQNTLNCLQLAIGS